MEYKVVLSVNAMQKTYISANSEEEAAEEAIAWLQYMCENAGFELESLKVSVVNVMPEHEQVEIV